MATERKAVIKNADMSEDMQQDAVDCASQALEKYNIEKDIAAFIKKVQRLFLMHAFSWVSR
jgi:dynein light chain LC8-type